MQNKTTEPPFRNYHLPGELLYMLQLFHRLFQDTAMLLLTRKQLEAEKPAWRIPVRYYHKKFPEKKLNQQDILKHLCHRFRLLKL